MITGVFIGLLDPRWREQQNKTVGEKKQQDEIFAVGMYIWFAYELECYNCTYPCKSLSNRSTGKTARWLHT